VRDKNLDPQLWLIHPKPDRVRLLALYKRPVQQPRYIASLRCENTCPPHVKMSMGDDYGHWDKCGTFHAMRDVKKILTLTLLGALSASGCVYVTASPSVQGKAFVVQKKLMSSSYWNCDATGDTPTCWEVKNVENGPAPAAGETPDEPAEQPEEELPVAEETPSDAGEESNE